MNGILNEMVMATLFSVLVLALIFSAAVTICVTLVAASSKDGEE